MLQLALSPRIWKHLCWLQSRIPSPKDKDQKQQCAYPRQWEVSTYRVREGCKWSYAHGNRDQGQKDCNENKTHGSQVAVYQCQKVANESAMRSTTWYLVHQLMWQSSNCSSVEKWFYAKSIYLFIILLSLKTNFKFWFVKGLYNRIVNLTSKSELTRNCKFETEMSFSLKSNER